MLILKYEINNDLLINYTCVTKLLEVDLRNFVNAFKNDISIFSLILRDITRNDLIKRYIDRKYTIDD